MLFRFIKHWSCKLQHQHLELWLADQLHAQLQWQPDLPLAAQLEQLFATRPAAPAWRDSLEFVVDTPHVNYLLVPWPQGITSPRELRQYASLLLAEQQEQQHEMKVSFLHSNYGEDAFAVLINQQLFATLKQQAKRQRLRLVSLCTPFRSMLAGFGRKLPENALIALVGEEESSFACRYQQRWHSVFTLRMPHSDLQQQLDTANRLAGLPPLERYVIHSQADNPLSGTLMQHAAEGNADE